VSLFFETYPELSIVGTIIYTPNAKVWFAGGCFFSQNWHYYDSKVLTNPDDYSLCDWFQAVVY